MFERLKIGVLALQGDFERHLFQLKALGVSGREVRLTKDLSGLDGLIIPGGESTTMNNLIDRFSMRRELSSFVKYKAVWGTCAGMIMLATRIIDSTLKPLGAIDITVTRNGYGGQVHSFFVDLNLTLGDKNYNVPASFIRAPLVNKTGGAVVVLAEFDNHPILLSQGNCLVSSFHTELHSDKTLLKYFIDRFVLPAQASQLTNGT